MKAEQRQGLGTRWVDHEDRFALLISALGLAGCKRETKGAEEQAAAAALEAAPKVKIWVSANGDIELDGSSKSLDEVRVALTELAKNSGVVLYGRDAPEGEPHPTAMQVMEIVVQKRLPIRMSTKRDFSDAVGR